MNMQHKWLELHKRAHKGLGILVLGMFVLTALLDFPSQNHPEITVIIAAIMGSMFCLRVISCNGQILRLLIFSGCLFLCTLSPQAMALTCDTGNLAIGGSPTGTLDSTHTSNTWCITTTDDGALQVNVSTDATLQVWFTVFASDGRTLAAGWGNGSLLVPNLQPDTYYVQIALSGGYGGYQIAATANGPNAFPFPLSWKFGSVSGTSSVTKLFTLMNVGLQNLDVGSIQITGSNVPDFYILDDFVSGLTVLPQGKATFNVVFEPTATGERHASVEIPSNDPDTPVTLVNLLGSGVGALPPPQPLLASTSSGGFNFGAIGDTRTIKITNTGSDPLKLGDLIQAGSNPGDFTITSNNCNGATLASMGSCIFSVSFNPAAVGVRSAEFQIPSNSPAGTLKISVSGSVKASAPEANFGVQVISGATSEPVNTATGNYYYQHTDLSLPGRGLPLTFTRTLNVQDTSTGPFGPGWTHSYNLKLTQNADGSVVVKMGDGHEEFYDSIGGGAYQAHDPGVFNTLVKNGDGSFVLTQKNQTRMAFTSAGRLLTISDRNSNSLSFAYNGAGTISTITDTVGRVMTLSYDANNHLVSIADASGRTVAYGYDANGRLISDTDPNGGVQHYRYDANGLMDLSTDRRGNTLVANTYDGNKRVVSQTNGKGAVTLFAYDTPSTGKTTLTDARSGITIHTHDILRRLVQETDPAGHSVNTVYDAHNNRTSVTDKNGNATAFTYDALGNVLSKTDAQGHVSTVQYNSVNDPLQIVDALGNTTKFAYDAKGNLTTITDTLSHATTIAYDVNGLPLSVTDPLNRITSNTFDAFGNLTNVKNALNASTILAYDAIGRRTGMTDANGNTASFAYDNNGNLVSVTDPLGHATHFVYDANNNRTNVTDPRGNTTAFVYDANDLLSKATDALNNFVQFAYDATDNRIKVTDPRGNITQYAYDAANRLTQVTDAQNHVTTLAYDANGNLLTQTNPLGHASSFAYDELNRLLSATDALGHQGFRSYDVLGRLTQAKDAQGRITQYAYDALGRLTKVTDAKGGTAVYDYDAIGNRIGLTDPNGHVTGYSYDALNRLTAKTDPLGQAYSYSYDPVGNRLSLTDAKGQNLLYSYDGNNRLTAINYPDNSKVSFGYDAAGNRIQMIDKLGTSTYVFDALNRLDAYTDAFGKTVANDYDQAGNRIALIYPDGKKVTYAYDTLNHMATVTDWLGGVTHYSYDAASKLTEVLNPNNTQVSYGYDAAERLVNLANAKANASVLSSYALTLDAVGNRSGIDRVEPLSPIFTNKTQALTYDNDNRLLTRDASAVTNDPNGNLTAEPGKSFQYDFEDRLVAATGDQSAQFSYDGVGNRLAATRNGQTTRYTLDVSGAMANVLVENDAEGTPTAYYVNGLGLISRITPSGEARYYHYDTIGSTVALTDAAGNVTDSYTYDPFGQIINAQGTANNPFRYVGQFGVMQEGNGLQFMRARYYEAGVGRFLNKDLLVLNVRVGQTLNRYSYVLNNPIELVDFTGLSAEEGGGVKTYSSNVSLIMTPVIHEINSTVIYNDNNLKSQAMAQNNNGTMEFIEQNIKNIVSGGYEIYNKYKGPMIDKKYETTKSVALTGISVAGKGYSIYKFGEAAKDAYSAPDKEVLSWIQRQENTEQGRDKLKYIAEDNQLSLDQLENLPQQQIIDIVRNSTYYQIRPHFFQSAVNLIKSGFSIVPGIGGY